ncbi:hypothetical protein [Priestia aryabhattai]|uniref:hypothetical protein n=1 Tax=Priestia aryabhattai TaxID=412384 RepID=UPI0015F6E24C|nr:hypothetical protein [Priestia aryabhattai]
MSFEHGLKPSDILTNQQLMESFSFIKKNPPPEGLNRVSRKKYIQHVPLRNLAYKHKYSPSSSIKINKNKR